MRCFSVYLLLLSYLFTVFSKYELLSSLIFPYAYVTKNIHYLGMCFSQICCISEWTGLSKWWKYSSSSSVTGWLDWWVFGRHRRTGASGMCRSCCDSRLVALSDVNKLFWRELLSESGDCFLKDYCVLFKQLKMHIINYAWTQTDNLQIKEQL